MSCLLVTGYNLHHLYVHRPCIPILSKSRREHCRTFRFKGIAGLGREILLRALPTDDMCQTARLQTLNRTQAQHVLGRDVLSCWALAHCFHTGCEQQFTDRQLRCGTSPGPLCFRPRNIRAVHVDLPVASDCIVSREVIFSCCDSSCFAFRHPLQATRIT